MLRFTLTLCCVIASLAAFAQDRIFLNDGTNIDAKVKEINPRTVVYRRWDNQDGADYTLTRREVLRIVYQNGTEERFTGRGTTSSRAGNEEMSTDRQAREKAAASWGKNILAIAPIQMTTEGVAGVGIHYEHFLDAGRIFSLYVPVAVTFYNEQTYNYGSGSPLDAQRVFTTIYPGAKIYPAGSTRRATYSIGGSFLLGWGDKYKETRTVDPGTGSTIVSYKEDATFKAGFMVHNGLNVQPTKHFYLGVEIGIGVLYYNNQYTNSSTIENGPEAQFNFKAGYRW